VALDEELAIASIQDVPLLPRQRIAAQFQVAVVVLQVLVPVTLDNELAIADIVKGPLLPAQSVTGQTHTATTVLQILVPVACDEDATACWMRIIVACWRRISVARPTPLCKARVVGHCMQFPRSIASEVTKPWNIAISNRKKVWSFTPFDL